MAQRKTGKSNRTKRSRAPRPVPVDLGGRGAMSKAEARQHRKPLIRVGIPIVLVLGVLGVLYGVFLQGHNVSVARSLEAPGSQVVTAPVLKADGKNVHVSINQDERKVHYIVGEIRAGQALRVRYNPKHPDFVVDARVSGKEATKRASQVRIAIVAGSILLAFFASFALATGRHGRR